MKFGEWIKGEILPPEPELYNRGKYLATVANNQVVALDYVKVTLRGKEITRWEYRGKISPWKVIAYMYFPEAYKEE